MKILLIYPYFMDARKQGEDVHFPPMGLYYIGALLREHGHKVEILNWSKRPAPDAMRKFLAKYQPDVAGFSILNGNRRGAVEIARLLRSILPHVLVVAGGVGATFLWEHILTHYPEIDVVVKGEGEYPFLDLVTHIQAGGAKDGLDPIPCLAFRKNGRIVETGPAKAAPRPDDLPNPARYFVYPHVSLSRGCPFSCRFCGSPGFWGQKVRFHSPDYFVDQIRMLHAKGVTWFFVSDDTFCLDKKRVLAVCRQLVREKMDIRWAAITRVEDVDEEILLWMRKAGCVQISFGVESGSEAIRKTLGKPLSTEKIIRAFELVQAHGIMARAYFIYGCPGETDETIDETIYLIKKIKPLSAIFYILALYPGTRLYDQWKKAANITDDIWLEPMEDIMYFQTDRALSADQVLGFGKRLRKAYFQMLPDFALNVNLKDDPELYPFHAGFLSRAGMTFSHGEYAAHPDIAHGDKTAMALFQKALEFHPHPRAYLGLGMLYQRQKQMENAVGILEKGLALFPKDSAMRICMGISHMNLGKFKTALDHLLKCRDNPDAWIPIAACFRELGQPEMAREYEAQAQKAQKPEG